MYSSKNTASAAPIHRPEKNDGAGRMMDTPQPAAAASHPPQVSKRRSSAAVTTTTASSYASPPPPVAAVPAANNYYTAAATAATPYNYSSTIVGSSTSSQQQQYGSTSIYWAPTATAVGSMVQPNETTQRYSSSHNTTITAVLWVMCAYVVFFVDTANETLQCWGVMWGLILYGLDLANFRDILLYVLWWAVLGQTCGSFWYAAAQDSNNNATIVTNLLQAGIVTLFYIVTAIWATLQFRQWHDDDDDSLQQWEAALHALLPPVFAALVTGAGTEWIATTSINGGTDAAATAAPHIFAVLMVTAMMMMSGGAVGDDADAAATDRNNNGKPPQSLETTMNARYAICRPVAVGHVGLLLLTPPIMHLTVFWRRLWSSRYAGFDDACDFVLAVTVPYLLWQLAQQLENSSSILRRTPYSQVANNKNNVLWWSKLVPWAVLLLASVALQQRYLIPMGHTCAYHFMGTQPSTWLLSLYWTVATVSLMASFWIWGRNSATTGQPLFGEYHEDIVQLFLAVAGLCLGKAFGLPWNMTPLPILALLGLSLWATTRMLRYLLIFLFVLHATGVVVFTYRFIGIVTPMALPLPNVELSLTRYGMLVTLASVLIGLVTGLAVRSTGGWMAPTLKRFDVSGLVLICYTLLLTVLEISLLKRPIPAKELAGVEVEEDPVEEMLYDPALALLTSAILIGICLYMKRVRILWERTSAVVISLAVGKAISICIESADTELGGRNRDPKGTGVLLRTFVAALLCLVMFAPRVFLAPVHVKTSTSRYKRSLSNGPDLPARAMRTIFVYAFVFLPATLFATIPSVLFPLVNVMAGSYRKESYYNVSTPISELIGATIGLWGLACLSTLNYFLPDGGGEAWKKLSALAFLMGIGIYFAAPTMGVSLGSAASSPYASMSSLGSQLINRGKSRTGGWGILSAALATLLAVSGPLELKERRHSSGRKDKYLLFRTMMFSLLFGGGVSWFITVQNMSESEWLFLILTLMASMTTAFLGTVAAVLGHFVEPENFDEVEQIAKAWFLGLCAFLPIGGIPQLIRSSAVHPFGAGGWLSTYLVVGGLSAFSFALSLRYRHGKDQRTRGLGNLGCIGSWVCAICVLYGKYGIAGLDGDYNMNAIAGIPASVIGTMAIAPILLALEGERSSQTRGRRISVTISSRADHSSMRLNLPQLTRSNRWLPLFIGTVAVFLCASLYAILLRGSGLLTFFGVSVARSHEDVFANVFGSASAEDHDLAALAEKTISHSLALATSAKLAGSGFWTANGFFGPLLHLAGVLATLPSLYLLVSRYWLGMSVPSSQVTLGLPLNVIPLFLCRGLPCLQAASALTVAAATMQLLVRRQTERDSKMRI